MVMYLDIMFINQKFKNKDDFENNYNSERVKALPRPALAMPAGKKSNLKVDLLLSSILLGS